MTDLRRWAPWVFVAALGCAPDAAAPVDAALPAPLAAATARLAEAPAEVEGLLAGWHPDRPHHRCDRAALLARAALRTRAPSDAAAALEAAWVACERADRPQVRSDLAGSLAWLSVVGLRDLDRAERALARLAATVPGWPAGAAQLAYYRGLSAAAIGDWRGAQRASDRAAALAAQWVQPKVRWAAVALAAEVAGRLGDHERAVAHLRTLLGEAQGCHRVSVQNNLAWALLGAPDAQAAAVPARRAEADGLLTAALAAAGPCRPGLRANLHTTRARLRLDQGDAPGAAGALSAARSANPSPEPAVALWMDELAARGLAHAGQWAGAADAYAALAAEAEASLLPAAQWRATVGQAEALAALGDAGAADAAYAEADGLLIEQARAVPLGVGHHGFYGDRAGYVLRRADGLVAQGRVGAAADLVRRHRRLALAQVAVGAKVAALTGPARTAWAEAIQAYQGAQAEAQELLARAALLDRAGRAEARQRARGLEARAQAALDRAYTTLGVDPGQVALAPPPPQTLLLVLTAERVFALDAEGARATVPWDGDGAGLLAALDGPLAAAEWVVVLAGARLADVDVHAWPWRGAPLGLQRAVVYGHDLPPGPAGGDGALVVSDPRSDLPAARVEGAGVARRLGAHHLMGLSATRAAVLDGLGRVERLHYAGHGVVDPESPLAGALGLAGGDRLTIADLLAAPQVPTHVVLSGCETARAAGQGVVVGLGLGQAFLAAGAQSVVAAVRPVDDALAAQFFAAYYSDPQAAPEVALRTAWQATRATASESDWASFRLLVR